MADGHAPHTLQETLSFCNNNPDCKTMASTAQPQIFNYGDEREILKCYSAGKKLSMQTWHWSDAFLIMPCRDDFARHLMTNCSEEREFSLFGFVLLLQKDITGIFY